MIIAHYAHRLPANYDIGIIRDRAKARGSLWDAVPELYFKGFLLRERGRFGAIANNYSSLYLWRQDDAVRDFLTSGRFDGVTDSFGRPQIETRFALDARRGSAEAARFAYTDEQDIPLDADLRATFKAEIERNHARAREDGAVAAAVGVDTRNWKLTRVLLSERAPAAADDATAYEILYLARPLLATLPTADVAEKRQKEYA
ncbi:MAG TPA: DUF4865 family protein [Xanthobacteraceae bacterium]|nr:DUF4865 family protein [Xanthobacteraceae bacterium]